jgi:hypothetical protein
MTGWRKRQVIEMAREAGFEQAGHDSFQELTARMEAFAALVREDALAQRTWVGLSDGVMCDIAMDHNFMSTDWIDFARAIEAKLKENNSAA